MIREKRLRRLGDRRGQTLVEYSLSILLLVVLMFGVFEMSRMILVYTTIADAAKIGMRFAEVHGTDNSATSSDVQTVVKNYLGAAPMNTSSSNLFITVTGAGGAIGSAVTVTVNYKYDPFMTYFPLGVYLASTSQGVITY